MIVALFGGSGTGKTTLAKVLEARLAIPRRSCGNAVRSAAKVLGVSPASLGAQVHRELDADTLAWAGVHRDGGGIVEGRFLDVVLGPLKGCIFCIEVTAATRVRAARLTLRADTFVTEAGVRLFDECDDVLRSRMYPDASRLPVHFRLDTTSKTVEECADLVERELQGWATRHA